MVYKPIFKQCIITTSILLVGIKFNNTMNRGKQKNQESRIFYIVTFVDPGLGLSH